MKSADKLPVHRPGAVEIELTTPSRYREAIAPGAGEVVIDIAEPGPVSPGPHRSRAAAAAEVVIDIAESGPVSPGPHRSRAAAAAEVVMDVLERQPLLAKPAGSGPRRYAELPLAAMSNVMQHLDVGDLRSMALTSSRWRSALGMPAVWLAASQRAGAAQLLRAKERLAFTEGRQVEPSATARVAVFLGGAVPVWALYGHIIVTSFRDPSGPSQFLGAINCLVGPILGIQIGSIASYMARPLFARMERAAEQRDARADLVTEQLQFGQACAREVLSPLPSDPALREAALGSLKRGLMRNATDATTVQAAFARAVDKGDVSRVEHMLQAGVARTMPDLQAAPELSRKLLMLLISADRLDTVAALAHGGVRLDQAMHGEVSLQAALAARLAGHLRQGNFAKVESCLAVLPEAATAHLPWTSNNILRPMLLLGLQTYPLIAQRLNGCFDGACERGDLEAAAALRRTGCRGSGAAAHHLARHLTEAVQSESWATVATLRGKLGVCTDHLAVKLDGVLLAAIAAGDANGVLVLRCAGALGKLLDASGRTPGELAQALGSPEVLAALQVKIWPVV